MKLDYKNKFENQNIDINELRPNKSYDYLIKNRNSSFKDLLKNKDEIKKFLIYRNCPICDNSKNKFKFEKDTFKIVECEKCKIIFVNPIFNEGKYKEIYQGKDYQNIVKELGESSHLYRKNRFGKERASNIEKFHDKMLPKTSLEIGCSTGFVMEVLNNLGWSTTGLELNPSAVNFAKKRSLNVLDIPLEDFQSDKRFSAIQMYDVLEHLTNPKNILNKAKNLLEKNGNIFIYVPNYNSATIQLLGRDNSHFIWPTHHLTYFTPETLKEFLENNGFEVFFWETQGLDITDWLWHLSEKEKYDTKIIEDHLELFQFYINAAGHGKNLRMYAKKK